MVEIVIKIQFAVVLQTLNRLLENLTLKFEITRTLSTQKGELKPFQFRSRQSPGKVLVPLINELCDCFLLWIGLETA